MVSIRWYLGCLKGQLGGAGMVSVHWIGSDSRMWFLGPTASMKSLPVAVQKSIPLPVWMHFLLNRCSPVLVIASCY